MLVILFITIVTVTLLIINLDLGSYINSNSNSNSKNDNKKIIKKINEKSKRVTFNLNNNKIKIISPRNKRLINYENIENNFINPDDIPVLNKPSIIKDKVNFGNNDIYGKGIIKNSNFFNSNHDDVPNPQREFVDKLISFEETTNLNEQDLFKNQKGYWESQVIDDYTNRTYDNIQVDNFNKFRENNHVGDNISNVFDELTGVPEKNGRFFGESELRHDDSSVMGKMDDKLYGYDHGCNNMLVQ